MSFLQPGFIQQSLEVLRSFNYLSIIGCWPFLLQDILDAIEFARGDPASKWGSARADMGHPEPFDLQYIAVGNQDCWNKNYRGTYVFFNRTLRVDTKCIHILMLLYMLGNYMKFYTAIKGAYPDIKIVSNCDGSVQPSNMPADLYDFHVRRDYNNN